MSETMEWVKRGRIYEPKGDGWRASHAMVATPWMLPSGELRLYVGFCSAGPVSRVGFIDLDPDNPSKVLGVSEAPALDIGVPGAFDDNGVVPTQVFTGPSGELFLSYAGFQQQTKVRYTIFSGLAQSHDGGVTFRRISDAPWLDRTHESLFIRSGAWIIADHEPMTPYQHWSVWYLSGREWREARGALRPRYSLRRMEVMAGPAALTDDGPVVLDLRDDEFGFGRPNVHRSATGYNLFFSARSETTAYRLGFARSLDGIQWERADENASIPRGEPGEWDSDMVCYGVPFRHRGKTWLFYNGNSYGETGLGLAELVGGSWD